MGWEAEYFARRKPASLRPMRRAFKVWEKVSRWRHDDDWLASLADSKVGEDPRRTRTINTLWIGTKVYFLECRDGPVSPYSYTRGRAAEGGGQTTGSTSSRSRRARDAMYRQSAASRSRYQEEPGSRSVQIAALRNCARGCNVSSG